MLLASSVFYIDALSGVMIALISFVGLVVSLFSRRYMKGDANYYLFMALLIGLVSCLLLMVTANHFLLMLFAFGLSNLLLVRLMVHKKQWAASAFAGLYALRFFILGFICLAVSFWLLYWITGSSTIQQALNLVKPDNRLTLVALSLMLISAMCQSAIWPFHRWLISSLNSPTPVSALMHAGLVNGGGFLLVRFAPLYLPHTSLLTIIFMLGVGTALIGALWKLIQNDIKRMLACSTASQMGFMFAQCGLGLFPAAVAHLCWHGLFKANLFLGSSGSIKPIISDALPSRDWRILIASALFGLMGSYLFSWASGLPWHSKNTLLFLIGIAFIACTQFSLTLLHHFKWKNIISTFFLTGMAGLLYGCSVRFIEAMISPLNLMVPQPMSIFHIVGFSLLTISWIAMLANDHLPTGNLIKRIKAAFY
ncbi:MAG: proton-conducting membrane transporter, partial [Gammaproteobacteria bacterium]|nr:proton-conducting membrane transporter [Gammaproteobacteria bacterium]